MPPKQNKFSGTLYGKYSTGEIFKIADIKDVTITEVDVALGSFDYVRVVRCKDCRFFKGDGIECHWGLYAYEDDYCSNGVRKEEKQ